MRPGHCNPPAEPKAGRALLSVVAAIVLGLAPYADAQTTSTGERLGSMRVTVKDGTQLIVAGAQVAITGPGATARQSVTDGRGVAEFDSLPPGRYDLTIDAPGFAPAMATGVSVRRGARASRDIALTIASFAEEVDVSPPEADQQLDQAFSTDLTATQIDALPEDPDELIAALMEMAGGDADLRIDGFTDSTLAPGARIQSVRIRYDSASASGAGAGPRIEIRTEPGGDRWRAAVSGRLRDESLNGRNRFVTERSNGLTRVGSWSVNGPLVKHRTGLSLSMERSASVDQQAINAAGLGGPLSTLVRQPNGELSVSARIDQAIGNKQTLRVDLRQSHQDAKNQGLSEFDAPERAIRRTTDAGELHLSHNATIGANRVHDIRLQLRWRSNETLPSSLETAIRVPGAISTGGAQQQGGRQTRELEYEDELMMPLGPRHQLTTGFNVIGGHYAGDEWRNAGGTFTFSSLDDLAFERPTTFTRRIGDPAFSYSLYRFGEFVQDDYRVRKNFKLNLGLRHEFQTHLRDWTRLAPRLGGSWTPSARLRTSLSASFSITFQPFLGSLYEQTLLVNGQRQQDIVISSPSYPDPFAGGTAGSAPPGVIRASGDLVMPTTRRVSIGVDQPIGKSTRVRASYARQTGRSLFRSMDINAPTGGARPDPAFRNITELESTGRSLNDSLQISLSTNYQPRRLNASVSYTIGQSFNDTDGALTLPPDSANLAQEWGPARQAIRHRINASVNSELLAGFRMSGNLRAQSAPPYTITTGLDANGDGVFNERPAGVGRNSARGAATKNVDLTLTWGRNIGQRPLPPALAPPRRGAPPRQPPAVVRLEVYAQANNVFNLVNLQGFNGVQTSPFFGEATSAATPRRFTFGARANF